MLLIYQGELVTKDQTTHRKIIPSFAFIYHYDSQNIKYILLI